MPKDTTYASKFPDADGQYTYSADEHAVWATLFERQFHALQGKAAPEFFEGLAALGLSGDSVPQVTDLDAKLCAISGAGVEGVPAIIPPTQFFTLLSQKKFPVATFLRRREDIDYIEEPDLFHEVFGHCPMLTNPDFAEFIQRFGTLALTVPKSSRWHMFRLFWFTVEFGMIRADGDVRAYGAGIVSSPSEAKHAMSEHAQLQDFDLLNVLRTPYRIDIIQPVYFVIDSFAQLADCLSQDVVAAIEEAKRLGDFPPLFEPAPD